MMRRLHRWIMTVFVILLLYWVASGLLLNIYDTADGTAAFAREGGGAGAAAPDTLMGIDTHRTPALNAAELESSVTGATRAVRGVAPADAITTMELHRVGDSLLVSVATAGSPPRRFVVAEPRGAITATPVRALNPGGTSPGWHTTIKRWHRGLMLGTTGATLSFLSGCALIVLVASGLALYCLLWQARRRSGRDSWLWR